MVLWPPSVVIRATFRLLASFSGLASSSGTASGLCAKPLGDPYIRGLPFPRISLSRELKPVDGQTVSVQPIAERTPRARLTRLQNRHTKIMRGLE